MRTARVLTNRACNQNCTFCNARRPRDDPGFVEPRAVAARLAAARREDATEIVLTGGEPTLRRDIARQIARARRLGFERVVLETNGTLITPERARELAQAGLDVARVHVPTWGTALDELTRDPGGFAALRRGLRALADAGVPFEAAVPIVKRNLDAVADVPDGLAADGLVPSCLVLDVPVEGPELDVLAGLSEAASAIVAVESRARALGLPVRLGQDPQIPPCIFPRPDRVAHLFAMTRGGPPRPGYARVAACSSCQVEDRCPGVPRAALDRPGMPELSPVSTDRLRRRLSVISSVKEQIARELVSYEVARQPDEMTLPMHTVRINFRCNQACGFCFVSTHLPSADGEAVRSAIAEGGRAGGVVALSGGEPTLNPELVDYVKLARRSGAQSVELQTNATRLEDAALTLALADAGVDVAFVSLHGSNAAISDAVTEAPGTFDKTVRGIDTLYASPIAVRLDFVFCQKNYRDFPDYVRMVADRWPRARLTVSFVAASTDVVPRTPELVPRYSDVLPSMAEGVRLAQELGVLVGGFESMCGMPLCLVPEVLEEYLGLAELPDGIDRGEFIKPGPCASCGLSNRCYGLRSGYAELYGAGELRPRSSSS